MLLSLYVQNFRAFQEQAIRLAPITVLIGPNNSGKSSLLAPLRLLSQTLQSIDAQVPLLLDGPLGNFGSFRDLVYGNHRGRRLTIGIEAELPSERTLGMTRPENLQPGRIDLTYKYRPQRRELTLQEVNASSRGRDLLTTTLSADSDRHQVTKIGTRLVSPGLRQRLRLEARLHHFLPTFYARSVRDLREVAARTEISPSMPGGDRWLLQNPQQTGELLRHADAVVYGMSRALRDIEYVSAMRAAPNRVYQHTGERHVTVGADGVNWPNILAMDSSRQRQQRVREPLIAWLRQSGLAADIGVLWSSDRFYEVVLQHPQTGERESVADVGQGISQVLPVLLAGLRLHAGSTYIVEEPEIHLHPRAQAELGSFFVDLLKQRGVQTLIETHSEHVILRLQQHVAAGHLSPSDIAIYYVHADELGKHVVAVDMDEQARLADVIPGGFFPEKLEEAKRLAKVRVLGPGAMDDE